MKDFKALPIARLGHAKLGDCRLLVAADSQQIERPSYEQVHGFTFAGEARFLAFLGELAITDVNLEVCRQSCLGVIEDNLNADIAQPLDWELSPVLARDGKAHQYRAELDDFIIESVSPDDE